jgi:hypothetical protein
VIYHGEWPSVGEYIAVGLVVIGIDAKFPIGIDAYNVDCDGCLLVKNRMTCR